MKLVIFGLTMSSSWGNGHATIWRGLCRGLIKNGHRVVFYERDVPYYAAHRDQNGIPGMELRLYADWPTAAREARRELAEAEIGMVTSYCPDGISATELVLSSPCRLRVFYDLDTPVTLECIKAGMHLTYVGPRGYSGFDIVLSFTGGLSLSGLREALGAREVHPLYGCVDPDIHKRVEAANAYRADLSYLGTYAADRQDGLNALLLEPARMLPKRRFVIGGSLYPAGFPWARNVFYFDHVPPPEHGSFYCSSRLTLNITRSAMAECGYCPSGRLFEAAACGVPVLSDRWRGLEEFFTPGKEILTASNAREAVHAIGLSDAELASIARAARDRALNEHTAQHRVSRLENILGCSKSVQRKGAP